MDKFNKGIAPLIAIIIIVAVVIVGGGAAYYYYVAKIQSGKLAEYDLQVSSNRKSLTIKSGDKIVKEISSKDLSPFDKTEGIYSIPEKDYIFSIDINDKKEFVFDKTRNIIYFPVVNKTAAGAANANYGLYGYNINNNQIILITSELMDGEKSGKGFNNITLSIDGKYLVYQTGSHGGACLNSWGLVIFDLNKNEKIAKLFTKDILGGGYIEFVGWKGNNVFEYEESIWKEGIICPDRSDDDLIISKKEYIITPIDQTAGWKTYKSENMGFEIKYPDILTVSKGGDKTIIMHAIPFMHTDTCDFKGDAPQLQKLTDFNVSIEIVDKDLINAVTAKEPKYFVSDYVKNNKIEIMKNFIDEINMGELKGYQITSGIEGCGYYTYYFVISPQKTLRIKRSFITELGSTMPESMRQRYLELPGVIKPEEETKLFNQILSTFKFTPVK